MARNLRSQALQRLAALAATSPETSLDNSDLDRLCRAIPSRRGSVPSVNGHNAPAPGPEVGRVPMTIREYEILLALCKTAPSLQTAQSAQKLSRHLIPYLMDVHVQTFAASPFFRKIEPSPTEHLSFHVTAALLSLGINHPDLRQAISDGISAFVNACAHAAEVVSHATAADADDDEHDNEDDDDPSAVEDATRTATIAVALLGFLDAACAQANFWRSGSRVGLVMRVRDLLSQPFLVAVEAAFSTIRNAHSHDRHAKEWKRWARHYDDAGRPLGAMLLQRSFMRLLVAATSLLIAEEDALRKSHILDIIMSGSGLRRPLTARSAEADFRSVELYATVAIDQMNYLESSADFDKLSPAKQKLAFSVKACALISYLNACTLNDDAADVETLMLWLEDALSDAAGMADDELATVVLKSMALLCRVSPSYAVNVSRLLPRFIVQSGAKSAMIAVASKSLAFVLQKLSKDAVITTLYTLGNVLGPTNDRSPTNGAPGTDAQDPSHVYGTGHPTGSSISLPASGEEVSSAAQGNVVQAICEIAAASKDEKITGLAQSMLAQKIVKLSSPLDARIVTGAATLALSGGPSEFRYLLKRYAAVVHDAVVEGNEGILQAVMNARNYISANIQRDSPLFDIYLEELLDGIISQGDVHAKQNHHAKASEVELAAQEIAQFLPPLAIFMSANPLVFEEPSDDDTRSMLRDAWFNIVVHGFTTSTDRGKQNLKYLRIMAVHSPPLVSENRGEQDESDIDLNPILRRGESSDRESMQKKLLTEQVPERGSEIRGLSYRKTIFLQAACLVESLRADAGDCSKALSYFLEPSMRRGEVSRTMDTIMHGVVDRYLYKVVHMVNPTFSAQYAAVQLAKIFCSCCHRIERVQQAAFGCADRLVETIPSALCQRSSLFTLLELLSLMWSSCLEAETDRYEPRTTFSSARGDVVVELSDDYQLRQLTLENLHKKAKTWLARAVNIAPADVKGLLQTYLSEFDEEGGYGHMSLGRSFALEIGSAIPSTDQRLSSLGMLGDCPINTASDFIAQFTARQEYRYSEALPDRGLLSSPVRLDHRPSFIPSEAEGAEVVATLALIEKRILSRTATPHTEVRDVLRRAAASLCRSTQDECSIVHYLVSIPFSMFTEQSIKLGISLWLGVMNENPRLEPRVLAEIVHQWEVSVQRRQGLFNPSITSPDPFFLRQEFAPSDNAALAKRRRLVHNLLAPHSHLLQFLSSHYDATLLGSPDTRRIFLRLLDVTLEVIKHSTAHPMAREIRFQVVLFGLKVLAASTTMDAVAQYRLKDQILSAGLSWFNSPPRWSFGSNILQLRTEIRLIEDVMAGLQETTHIGTQSMGPAKSLAPKEKLLVVLLESEHSRLHVWARPVDASRHQISPFHYGGRDSIPEAAVQPLVRTAWAENPSLAVHLASRFPYARIQREVRGLLLNLPAKAAAEPEAIPILIGGALPDDVSFQLKYLLFWAPVNPITAVTLFLPAYRNHPYLIQYAMRALESHSVDVTFFYVPQIVQTLRHDALGYVERYILQTAQFSQLFAHQIIWNMKANAYKDDDSKIPDTIKPTLDKVMDHMINSFSPADRDFYEREFSFFAEVTSISGKLKPLIKRPKPEKKQKIEEELRKIKVEVGVYLPSNPDGVVVGIDRKSGKPLQSHAKAPFMATFRIRKNKSGIGEAEEMLEENAKGDSKASNQDNTVEVWQSAIFKVGDDCRQDVLALQMIAAFRGIFHSVGLDVYVFPYRVTATAPGCGVIDVLPNSISRDMLGREAVNGLYDYFVSKYGNEDSLRFQQARNNFVKSMAAYSVISFLLQFKDRHNGNIMIDDAGHILHIDFGFCFDIAPGGIKFERAPFKLTAEMVRVMGGSPEHQAFKWFEELCVKAFLASRQHTEKLSQIVLLMMDSGLPCFKPESVRHFKERFVLEKSDRDAAEFMRGLIKRSYSSYSTGIYDQFQLLTNGIPY